MSMGMSRNYCTSAFDLSAGNGAVPPTNAIRTHRKALRSQAALNPSKSQCRSTSAPIPKFASHRGTSVCELRNQRCTSNILIPSAAFEFEVPKRVCRNMIGTSNSKAAPVASMGGSFRHHTCLLCGGSRAECEQFFGLIWHHRADPPTHFDAVLTSPCGVERSPLALPFAVPAAGFTTSRADELLYNRDEPLPFHL